MKALEIDGQLAEAHASLGSSKRSTTGTGAARPWNCGDIELNPNYASAHQWLGMSLFSRGQFEEALTEFHRARALDPLSFIIAVTAIWPPHLGQSEEALRQLQKVIEMHSEVPDLQQ
jgi:tetratricopeptide (TPR) repeat protein